MRKSNNIIYKITNTINGKVYVGLTTQGLASRMSEHKYRLLRNKRDHKLYRAFRKHGFENFKFEAVCTALNEKDLPDLEMGFIRRYDSFINGYNMNIGGSMVSEETRNKLSEIFKGRKITWYDKILKSRMANPNRKQPKDYVAKGANNVLAKSYLIQFPHNGYVYLVKGLREFCRVKGLTHSNLFATFNGGQNYHRGYRILARFNDQSKDVHSSEWKRAVPSIG
jgi:group I intron endonuclease